MEIFKFGVRGLDELLVNALIEGQSLVIAGHPGAGKTTLASMICYVNALNGHKCLYLSLQEDKDKLYMNMKRLGIDFEAVEKSGYFKYIKLPLMATEDAVTDIFMDTVNRSIEEFKPRIFVIDSITPVLKAASSSVKARAILQNFFAELPRLIKGIVVLIAEIPLGREEVELGDIEFVTDMIITLKHRVERGLLTRIMEIRKSRGSPLTLVEIPFSIREGYGIEAWVSPRLEEIIEIENPLEIPCESLKRALGYINKGDVIYWEYPAYMRSGGIGLLLQLIAVANRLKTLYISYKHAPSSMYNVLYRLLEEHGVSKEVVEYIKNTIIYKGINPFAYSVSELNAIENQLIDELRPDMVVFHGVDVPMLAERRLDHYIQLLFNQIVLLKQKGITIARYSSHINNELSNINASLADIVIKILYSHGEDEPRIHVWRRGGRPAILTTNDIYKCIDEIIGFIRLNMKPFAK